MNDIKIDVLKSKLTPAAIKALEELVEDYVNQILIGAEQSAASLTGEAEEISVRDVLTSVDRARIRRTTSLPKNLELALRLYIFIGIFLGIVGFGILLYRNLSINIKPEEQYLLMISVSGILLAFVSYAFLSYRQSKATNLSGLDGIEQTKATELSMIYINRWQEFELSARNKVSNQFGESVANKPISSLINILLQDKGWTKADEHEFRKLLDIRNNILHGGLRIDLNEYKAATKAIDRLMAKLS